MAEVIDLTRRGEVETLLAFSEKGPDFPVGTVEDGEALTEKAKAEFLEFVEAGNIGSVFSDL